jgi:hypothetical protein
MSRPGSKASFPSHGRCLPCASWAVHRLAQSPEMISRKNAPARVPDATPPFQAPQHQPPQKNAQATPARAGPTQPPRPCEPASWAAISQTAVSPCRHHPRQPPNQPHTQPSTSWRSCRSQHGASTMASQAEHPRKAKPGLRHIEAPKIRPAPAIHPPPTQ